MKLKNGMLISVEGIDGSGKSTLIKNVAQLLRAYNLPVILTKEPGGSALGKQLRTILQTQTTPLTPKAEYLLFAANRAQHFHEVIMPNLQQHNLIISDRMADSSLVYQGYGRGLDLDMLRTINRWAMNTIQPDLTVYIKIPYNIARDRIAARKQLTTFEKEHENFIKKLMVGFDEIFTDKKNVIQLDGTKKPDDIAHHATERIMQWIQQTNR